MCVKMYERETGEEREEGRLRKREMEADGDWTEQGSEKLELKVMELQPVS